MNRLILWDDYLVRRSDARRSSPVWRPGWTEQKQSGSSICKSWVESNRLACLGLWTTVLRKQRIGGVKFIGNSELWCWEVVKLLSYTRRGQRGRQERGGSLVVYCFYLFTSLPCRGLFTTTRPLHTTTARKITQDVGDGTWNTREETWIHTEYCLRNLNRNYSLGDLQDGGWRAPGLF